MNPRIRIAHAAALALLATGLVACQSSSTRSGVASDLTDDRGMTLYTFDKDRAGSGSSACYGACAAQWPPVAAGRLGARESAPIRRDDGSAQATLDDRELYYFAGDARPGDRNGDGIGGVWHVARNNAGDIPARHSSARSDSGYAGYGGY